MRKHITDTFEKTVFDARVLDRTAADRSDIVEPITPMAYQARLLSLFEQTDKPREFESFSAAFSYHAGSVLLLGEAGGGKTTTLLVFALEKVHERLESESALLPIYAPIRYWDGQLGLIEWLALITKLDSDQLRKECQAKNILLLLDGPDELPVEALKEDDPKYLPKDYRIVFMRQLAELDIPYVVVTCRTRAYEEIVEKGGKLALTGAVTLKPLTDEQIRTYLTSQPDLWLAFQADKAWMEIARNPLILSRLAFAFKDTREATIKLDSLGSDDKGATEKALFTVVEKLYASEQLHTRSNLPFTLHQLYALLGRIALVSSARGKGFNLDSANTILLDVEKARSLISLAQILYLIVPESDNTYRFLHLLFHDLFVRYYDQTYIGQSDKRVGYIAALFDLDVVTPITGIQTHDLGFIPGKSIRGSLRYAFERIFDYLGAPTLCKSILSNAIFGTPNSPGRLFIHDFHFDPDDITNRARVSIGKSSRPGKLFREEGIGPTIIEKCRLEFFLLSTEDGRFTDDDVWFSLLLQALFDLEKGGMGSGRTSGNGQIRIKNLHLEIASTLNSFEPFIVSNEQINEVGKDIYTFQKFLKGLLDTVAYQMKVENIE